MTRRGCPAGLTARAAGRPVRTGHRDAVATRDPVGADLAARVDHRPLWRRLGPPERAPAPGRAAENPGH
ncbi:hypothetical protein [Streptomyces sp. NPDC001889]